MNQLNWKPITLAEKTIFEKYLSENTPYGHEYTFANFFSWRLNKSHRWTEYKNHLLVAETSVSKHWKLYEPIGPKPAKIIQSIVPIEGDYSWHRLSYDTAHSLNVTSDILLTRNDNDYVYNIQSLIALEGKKYDAKRNFIKRMSEYNPIIKPIDSNNIKDCYQLSVDWATGKNLDNDGDLKPLAEIINNFEAFQFEGIGVYVEEKMVGFALGERLKDDIFGERYEKCFTQYTGIYPFILHHLANYLKDNYKEINREQDLGIPGLRKSKLSWQPNRFETKYALTGSKEDTPLIDTDGIYYRKSKTLNKEAVTALYKSCKWSCIDRCPEKVHAALDNSDTVISAWDGTELVGLINAISDQYLTVYFPHLLIKPTHQKKGIGHQLMTQIMTQYEAYDQKVLISHKDTVGFYEKLKFKTSSPHEGMWIHNSTDL